MRTIERDRESMVEERTVEPHSESAGTPRKRGQGVFRQRMIPV